MEFIHYTGVGNTGYVYATRRGRPVHPHGCGEHLTTAGSEGSYIGSSPRVWGTPEIRPDPVCKGRFIPTGVGNTTEHYLRKNVPAVHPHGCGEHRVGCAASNQECGSSPRVWGTLMTGEILQDGTRFIPTGVGNTVARLSNLRFELVHPHGCGEHGFIYTVTAYSSGSSPRVWGTPPSFLNAIPITRFIPTGVGNTWAENESLNAKPVHPHGCGEHWAALYLYAWDVGSSPRVWGTPPDRANATANRRFIPTGVGNTA